MITISLRMDKKRLAALVLALALAGAGAVCAKQTALAECASGGEHRLRPEGEYSCRQ